LRSQEALIEEVESECIRRAVIDIPVMLGSDVALEHDAWLHECGGVRYFDHTGFPSIDASPAARRRCRPSIYTKPVLLPFAHFQIGKRLPTTGG
jgi:hypothetical protein